MTTLLSLLCGLFGLLFSTVTVSSSSELTDTEADLTEDVTKGRPANIEYYGKFAFVIGTLLRYDDDGTRAFYPIHNCGASMIQRYPPILLMTAAHCVKPIKGPGGGWTDSRNPNEYWAFRGWNGPAQNVQHRFGDFRAYRIEEVYFPKAWEKSKQSIFADVAIVRVDSGESGRYHFNIPLATPRWKKEILQSPKNPDRNKKSVRLEITGWGMDSSTGQFATSVQSGSVWYIPPNLCDKMIAGYKKITKWSFGKKWFLNWFKKVLKKHNEELPTDGGLITELCTYIFNLYKPKDHWVFDDEICAIDIKKGETSTCYGDSGGPLSYQSPQIGTYTLWGVTSSSIAGDCEPKLPVMYSNLEYYNDWIKSLHACIMLDRMNEWTKVTVQSEYQKWTKEAIFWNNENRKGCVPDMVWRANRNRATEPGFKKWYVSYMWKHRSVMQQWCNMKSTIENFYDDSTQQRGTFDIKHTSDELKLPGFFPMMVEFSEWPNETREEKYHRAWGKPWIIRESSSSIFSRYNRYPFIEDNMAVSMDLVRFNNHWNGVNPILLKVFDIMELKLTQSTLILNVGKLSTDKYPLFCQVNWTFDKINWIHIEVVLYYGNRVKMSVDGRWVCSGSRTWKPSTSVISKLVQFGHIGINHKPFDPVARNVEFRTWTDPPVCCDRMNLGDSKCIPGCDQAKHVVAKVCR